jgi:hypothetical protein
MVLVIEVGQITTVAYAQRSLRRCQTPYTLIGGPGFGAYPPLP